MVRWLLGNSCVRTSCVVETSPSGSGSTNLSRPYSRESGWKGKKTLLKLDEDLMFHPFWLLLMNYSPLLPLSMPPSLSLSPLPPAPSPSPCTHIYTLLHVSSIQGFMQKADAEKMFLQCVSGTFLIRFNEGEPGDISVAWVTGELTRDNVD